MRESWHDLLRTWAVDHACADRKFDELRDFYAGPGRFYHTLCHVNDMLRTVERLASHTEHSNAVQLGAWLHDVIYDTKAPDNEERSAEFAERLCQELSIADGRLVGSLILKTKTHDAAGDADAQVLLDADLAILGADEAAYWTYVRQIRWEYDWVPEDEYKIGRRRILERFLARPRIYHHLQELEAPARHNIAVEIARLAS